MQKQFKNKSGKKIVLKLITAEDPNAWHESLQEAGPHDIYHTLEYHLATIGQESGVPHLIVVETGNFVAAMPFLLRRVPNSDNLFDATTVYGYPGIVCNSDNKSSKAQTFKELFQKELSHLFSSMHVVSFFARTNPLIQTNWLFEGCAEIVNLGATVFIDLTLPEDQQFAEMTKGHRYDIRKGRRSEVVVEEDVNFDYIDEFIGLYNETMVRTGASKNYFFPRSYYLTLKERLKGQLRLYMAKNDSGYLAGSLFFFQDNIIQYHLSGSTVFGLKTNSVKLIIDEVRKLGSRSNFSLLHLGGGVGAAKDNLLKFKCGFSRTTRSFETVRMVVDKKAYARLAEPFCRETTDFFPIYRRNSIPRVTPERLSLPTLEQLIRKVLSNNNRSLSGSIDIESHLVNDLGLDSLDLAELTVLVEEKTGVDIFENKIVFTIQDVLNEVSNR